MSHSQTKLGILLDQVAIASISWAGAPKQRVISVASSPLENTVPKKLQSLGLAPARDTHSACLKAQMERYPNNGGVKAGETIHLMPLKGPKEL